MTPGIFLNTVIRPTLAAINFGIGDTFAENILLGTAIQESHLQDIVQTRGPALGYFQMEPETHDDIWRNFLAYKPKIGILIKSLVPSGIETSANLLNHPQYECAMARMFYARCPGAIPQTLLGQAHYYKQFYNTPLGAATETEYVDNFLKFCGHFPYNDE